jgi:hypothetical protein
MQQYVYSVLSIKLVLLTFVDDGTLIDLLPFVYQIENNGNVVTKVGNLLVGR